VPAHRPDLGPCYLWTRGCFDGGYGAFWIDGQNHPAHIVAYELVHGPVPEGKQLDHLCRVHNCVRESHVEPVDCRTNLLRGETLAAENTQKTSCKHGHEFTPENTYYAKNGSRVCRTCNRMRQKAYVRRRSGDNAATADQFSSEYRDSAHCKYGHLMTAENTKIRIRNGHEHRICVECARARGRRYMQAKRQSASAS
jgi:hypothetical protein